MNIKIAGYDRTIETEIKTLVKEAGRKVKDIGECILSPQSWGVGLTILDTNGKYITSCAM